MDEITHSALMELCEWLARARTAVLEELEVATDQNDPIRADYYRELRKIPELCESVCAQIVNTLFLDDRY